jgi:hypothetical protein
MISETGFGKKYSFGLFKVLALQWAGPNDGNYENIRIANVTA